MNFATEIVLTASRFAELAADAPDEVVVDVENRGEFPSDEKAALLGVSFAYRKGTEIVAYYVPFREWSVVGSCLNQVGEAALADLVSSFIASRKLVGHGCEHDRIWLDGSFGLETLWVRDTRKGWHLLDESDSLHGFGLKTAQVEVLGWRESNDSELAKVVEERGGKLSKGDHYLAPLPQLGHYACLDTIATLLLDEWSVPRLRDRGLLEFFAWRMRLHKVLSEATVRGTPVDVETLFEVKEGLVLECERLKLEIREVCKDEVETLEKAWAESKAASYKRPETAAKFLSSPSSWRRFNPNSAHQRTTLFHDVLGLPVTEKTPTGRAKSDRATIAKIKHPVGKAFVTYSEVGDTLEKANSYIAALKPDNTIHFPYNNCGTVSDRLGGYKPYSLNMPFSEERLMSAFKVPEGFIGIHSDLKAIEPCLIASYSEDPVLLKVHRDGLGDVYLDFALDVFPDNLELQETYDPNVVLTSVVKNRFKAERDLCKTLHLALGYTGTEYTIARQLGITPLEAKRLVRLYWKRFEKVASLDFKLRKLHDVKGFLTNVLGRRIVVPKRFQKDTLNRFIQSGGHDILTAWVLAIDERRRANLKLQMYPVLPDIHDSTSWAVKEEFYAEAKAIYDDSLAELNQRLNLSVRIGAETKPFRTFAGLKGSEN